MEKIKVNLDLDKVIRITGNDGGYLSGECIACDASGWIDGKFGYKSTDKKAPGYHLKHKKRCPINQFINTTKAK